MGTFLYKLTTQDFKTRQGYRNECTWGENVSHSGTGVGRLCGPGWIHAYTSPLLAVLLNPVHAGIANPVLWECSHSGVALNDNGLKVGCRALTTLRQISLPAISVNQKVIFGVLCALEVYRAPSFVKWANDWLAQANRDASAAYGAVNGVVAEAAACAANGAYAAACAANGAYAAACAANGARAAANAAFAARAAEAAACAAEAAALAAASLDLEALAKRALSYN